MFILWHLFQNVSLCELKFELMCFMKIKKIHQPKLGSEFEFYLLSIIHTVFVLPPSIKELEVRLKNRRQDSKETISKRISFAKEEIQKSNKFDVLILNNSFKDALNDLKQVVTEQGIAEQRQEEASRVASKLLEDASI